VPGDRRLLICRAGTARLSLVQGPGVDLADVLLARGQSNVIAASSV
jgi:hypothetical protein